MPSRLTNRLQRLYTARCAVVAVALGSYLLTSLGIPLPIGTIPATASASFACQGRACGCASAEQCRKSCCCFKPRAGCGKCQKPVRASGAVLGIAALKCQGIATDWVVTGGVVLPLIYYGCSLEMTAGDAIHLVNDLICHLAQRPPTPPPRLGLLHSLVIES